MQSAPGESSAATMESGKQRQGLDGQVAKGKATLNEGERRCLMLTFGAAAPQRMVF